MGAAGPAGLAPVIEGARARGPRFAAMRGFFEGVGSGPTAGIWLAKPEPRPARKRAIPVVERRKAAEESL